jgi:hypothetical protein
MNTKFETRSSATRTWIQSRVEGLVSGMLTHGSRQELTGLTMLNTRRNGWYEVLGVQFRAYELRSERSFRTSRRATRTATSKSATFSAVLTIDFETAIRRR